MIILFDTETTGLTIHPRGKVASQPRIIEFGAVILDDHGCEVETFNQLINPECNISDEITKITGITNDDVRDMPTFREAVEQIEPLFGKCRMVVAHNLNFDRQLIASAIERTGRIWDTFPWPEQEMCTVQMYRELWGRNPKLLELYERVMGVPLAQTHRALDDVRAVQDIFVKERLWTYLN